MNFPKPSHRTIAASLVVVAALAYLLASPAARAPVRDQLIPSTESPATEAPVPAPAAVAPAPAGIVSLKSGIVLSAKVVPAGISLTWTVPKGKTAPYGFKILKSTGPNPTYPTATSVYLGEPAARSYTWEIRDGITYHFRLCTWNGLEGAKAACTGYSNDVAIKTPEASAPLTAQEGFYETTGELALTATKVIGGISLRWTPSTLKTFTGYRILRSEANHYPSPVKDSSIRSTTDRTNTAYLDAGVNAFKTYYYRVCLTQKNDLPVCGNIVTVAY